MATDFGDESGEKLFDWMLRVGQEAGQEALAKSAEGLAEAIRSTCASIEKSEGSGGAAAKTTEWAKLSMREFEDLPEYETLADMMAYNVTAAYGTSRFPNMDICAKSGTAEVGEGQTPHAWFAGFLRGEETPYAFVVLVENGGGGSSVAGGVAAKVLDVIVNGY